MLAENIENGERAGEFDSIFRKSYLFFRKGADLQHNTSTFLERFFR
jgi:hypothetical protein